MDALEATEVQGAFNKGTASSIHGLVQTNMQWQVNSKLFRAEVPTGSLLSEVFSQALIDS